MNMARIGNARVTQKQTNKNKNNPGSYELRRQDAVFCDSELRLGFPAVLSQGLFVCWLLNVPATCECISGTDLLRQFYVLPH